MIFLSRFFFIIRNKVESRDKKSKRKGFKIEIRDKNINVKRYLDEEG